MNPAPERYRPSPAELLDLVTGAPLAWIVSAGPSFHVTPLPLRPRVDAEGRLTALAGHFPGSSPHLPVLRAQPRALMLFTGPQAYISPSWLGQRNWAPTWQSATAAFAVDVAFADDPAALRETLADLIDAQEAGRPSPWTLEELGERYAGLAPHIHAFRAEIRETRAAFRLGQDEAPLEFAQILAGLRGEGREDMAGLMERFARARP
jgi:transcriptional regulator